ncbi:hypothetical protein EMCRGX_G027472 [Ephydatia muelleri]
MAEDEAQTSAQADKVVLRLKPLPNTPIIKSSKFYVDKTRKISWLLQWLKQNLKCEANESVFVYIQQAFCPAPDQTMDALCEMYGTGNSLIISYSKQPAFG